MVACIAMMRFSKFLSSFLGFDSPFSIFSATCRARSKMIQKAKQVYINIQGEGHNTGGRITMKQGGDDMIA